MVCISHSPHTWECNANARASQHTVIYKNCGFLCCTSFVYSALTSLRQKLDGLQHTLSVDPRFVVFHLSINDVDHTSSSAPDCSSSSVKSVNISLLQSNYTFVDILKDVVFFGEAKKTMTVNRSGVTQGFFLVQSYFMLFRFF